MGLFGFGEMANVTNLRNKSISDTLKCSSLHDWYGWNKLQCESPSPIRRYLPNRIFFAIKVTHSPNLPPYVKLASSYADISHTDRLSDMHVKVKIGLMYITVFFMSNILDARSGPHISSVAKRSMPLNQRYCNLYPRRATVWARKPPLYQRSLPLYQRSRCAKPSPAAAITTLATAKPTLKQRRLLRCTAKPTLMFSIFSPFCARWRALLEFIPPSSPFKQR